MTLVTNVNDPNRARYGLIETFTTTELDQTKILVPDGDNGVVWVTETLPPNGWGFYSDGLIANPTQTITVTPVKLLIDGNGATSEDSYLPRIIRGTGQLYDTTDNLITPIVVGDSYDMRVQVNIDSLSGNPTELSLVLDIGGAATPTITITQDTKVIKGLSEPVIFSFPIFALATFLSNGGQLFMKTDTGSAVIGTRDIFLIRTSSGDS